MTEYFAVGYVLRPQGIKGEIKVEPLTDHIRRFDELYTVLLEDSDGYRQLNIENIRYIQDAVILKIQGYDDVNCAETLRNKYLWIPRSMAKELPEYTYFMADIIGCSVKTQGGDMIGTVKDIIYTKSNDVYVIDSSSGDILIPALKKVVKDVDVRDKVITIDITGLEGLFPYDV